MYFYKFHSLAIALCFFGLWYVPQTIFKNGTKMKILYILNKSVLSGPNIVALTNAEELHKRGCDVTVCFIKYGLDLSLYYPFLEEIKVMYFDGLGYLRGLRAFYNFVKKKIFKSYIAIVFYLTLLTL